MSFASVQLDLIRWAEARRIIPNASGQVQLMKCVSELGELCEAWNTGDRGDVINEYGDLLNTLILFGANQDIDPVRALEATYRKIKDRRGTMLPNGCFVKE